MSDKFPYFAAETGTYSTNGPSVNLSGTAASIGAYPARTFSEADADATIAFASGNTCTVVIVKDSNNYKRYTDATWTDASQDTIGLASAVLEGSSGTIGNGDAVTVYASLPTKFSQSNTHESPDTDSATTALHHTIGTGANQAAAGNHSHTASAIESGTIATARLGSGTADNTTYLRGDQTWGTVSGGSATQAFGTVSVSGQSDVVADSAPDTLTLVAGSNITITTNASADSITIAASGGATNLSVTNKTGTTLDIASDTGTDATIPAASGTEAGLMTATQYTKLSGIESSASAAGATGDAFASSHPGGNQHIDWTADQGATNIHSGNVPDLSAVYATAAKGVTNGDSHDHSGGDGAQISYSGLSNVPSSFTPAAHASSHSTGQTDAISPANIGAEPTQTAASQAEAEAGSVTSIRSFTPQRVFQAIAAKVAAMFGTTAGTVCQGDDSRLSDSRTPTSHDHSGNKLAQANTHESADTDSATSSIHHTIGTGATNAAAGNHIHDPDKLSGVYYSGCMSASTFGTGAASANVFRAYPFVVRKAWTITEIVCEVTAGGGAGTKYRIAIYSDDGSLRPGNIVSGTDVAESDADTVGFTTFTFANPITLSPGVYWAAHLTNSTPTMRTIAIAAVEPILGVTASSTTTFAYASVAKGSFNYGPMPSSISGTVLSSSPVAAFRMKTQ